MIKELEDAAQLLQSALERYTNTCLFIANTHNAPNEPYDIIRKSLASINNVFSLVASYKKKWNHAKAVINQTRNSLSIVPINSLPDELIARIFRSVLDTVARRDMNPVIQCEGNLPTHAKDFLHICSRWRRIAVSSCVLWRRVNVVLSHPHFYKLLDRGAMSASFSGGLPLDIYIVDRFGDPIDLEEDDEEETYIDLRLRKLCCIVLPRARSFTLSLHTGPLRNRSISPLLNHCIANFTPGTLTRLSITTHQLECREPSRADRAYILAKSELPPVRGYNTVIWRLDTTTSHIDELLRPITELHLDAAYFHWDSCAYHGLTELILTNQYERRNDLKIISVSQLVQILRSSPRLGVLWFGMDLMEEEDDAQFPPPVELHELKALVLSSPFRSREIVLQLISAGPKLQRMGIIQADSEMSSALPSEEGLVKFCTRSRIMQFYLDMKGRTRPTRLSQIFKLFPDLQTLIMFGSSPVDDDTTNPDLNGDLSTHPIRDELRLIGIRLLFRKSLKPMERRFKKITLSGCPVIEPEMENRFGEWGTLCKVVGSRYDFDLADWSRGL
ncbi:F-box-like domain containing protein [Ceratobasidium theobromae]|uniref:F-box-like domain containing protein n=1 Tax=Ceratobasidium theobromae TaxID=1582974 RepID=A0A5N5QG35_9AGAM|nr:F-box-like domain containing protein [Ceratobasidium theobromae]